MLKKRVNTIITLSQIQEAIVNNITQALIGSEFDGVVFSSTNIAEKITRPSFYLDFEDSNLKRFNYSTRERDLYVKLYYYAKNKNTSKLELLKIQELLENLFLEEIKVTDNFYFPVSEVEFDRNKNDGYLTASLNLYSLEEIDFIKAISDEAEFMEELIYNKNKI